MVEHKTAYDWIGGKPVVSDETNYDWSGGKPRIVYEYTAAPPVGVPRQMDYYMRQRRKS